MPRPDEGLIHAWLDGELDAAEAARVEKLVAEDTDWGAAAAEARGLIAASSRILGALDVVPGDVIPGGGRAAPAHDIPRIPTPQVAPRRMVPTWLRVAAGAVLVAGVGYLARDEARPSVGVMIVPDSAAIVPSVDAEAPGADARVRETPPPVRIPTTMPAQAARTSQEAPTAAVTADAVVGQSEPSTPPLVRPESVAAKTAVAAPPTPAVEAAQRRFDLAEREARLAAPSARALAPMAATAGRGAEPERILDSPNSISRVFAGCWRAETTVTVDSLQRSPLMIAERGDTLVLAFSPPGTTANVVRVSEIEIRGLVRDASGRTAPLRAVLTTCPR